MSQEFSHEEQALGKVYDHRLMKRLMMYVRPYWRWALLGLGFSMSIAILSIMPLYIIKQMIDGPVAGRDMSGILFYSSLFLTLLVLNFFFLYANQYLLAWLGQNVVRDLRVDLFQHLLRERLGFFDRTPVGRLMTRMTSDISALQEIVSSGVITIVQDLMLLAGLLVFAFWMNWKLALLVFSVLPVLIITVFFFSRRLRDAFRVTRLAQSRVSSYLQESITGMREIQAFRAEERSEKQHDDVVIHLRECHLQTIFWFALFWPSIDIVSSGAVALLAWYAAGFSGADSLQIGTLTYFILSIDRFFWPIRDLSEKYNLFQSAMASAERVFKLMDEKDYIDDAGGAGLTASEAGTLFNESIRLEDVWFAYKEEDWVLKGIGLEIKKGQHVAIVGSTGSGKTTITNLLMRFYEHQKGRITIDGRELADLPLADLRSLFALVLQDVFLFTGDLASNIALSEDLSDDELWEIAKKVNADKFISDFENGLAHEVRERGATFSAGERQLIAFARALAFDPEILILDEATSNIDTETERLIQEAIEKLLEGRTAVIIAHRLSTIRHCDEIIVLHHGQIAERGTHDELLAKGGLYSRLHELQMQEAADPAHLSSDTFGSNLASV